MASSILVRSLLEQVSRHLTDFNPQFTRWTQVELLAYLRDAQVAIAKYMPTACPRIDAIKLAPGTKQQIRAILAANVKPGDGSTAADVHGNCLVSVSRLMGADGASPGRALRVVDRDVLDTHQPDWHTKVSATPTQYAFDPRTPQIFYVAPGIPTGSDVWLEVTYLADPAPIPSADYSAAGSATATLSIDDKYADDIVNYMMARAYVKEAEYAANANLSAAHTNLFVQSINAQVTALTGVNPNLQSLPMNPATLATAR